MKPPLTRQLFSLTALVALLSCAAAMENHKGRLISQRFKQLTRAHQWKLVASSSLKFNTHHPQGLVKVGTHFYLSSVEVTQPTKRFSQPVNGLDRDAGAGIGHLFKFDQQGNLVADLKLGEDSIYHPGGIDFDGRYIWVPVAEYRPNSRSIVYRLDPADLKITEAFRFNDHLGGIVHNTDNQSLVGVSWGSRFFYRWALNKYGRVINTTVLPAKLRQTNSSFYIDYQDCKFLGGNEMLCVGLSRYQQGKTNQSFSLGGMELVDLNRLLPTHQLPIELWTESGFPMTQNPFWMEAIKEGLRVYFLPEDQKSTLYIYEVSLQ